MFDPPGFKENCPYCKYSKMEYYGFTPGGFHFYYRCSNCRKYAEYYFSSKTFLTTSVIIFLIIVFAIALTLFIWSISHLSAILFFLGFIVLSLMANHKYGRYSYKSIALEDLQTDLWIIRAASKRSRLVIAAIFFVFLVVFLAYIGIFIVNLTRQ